MPAVKAWSHLSVALRSFDLRRFLSNLLHCTPQISNDKLQLGACGDKVCQSFKNATCCCTSYTGFCESPTRFLSRSPQFLSTCAFLLLSCHNRRSLKFHWSHLWHHAFPSHSHILRSANIPSLSQYRLSGSLSWVAWGRHVVTNVEC